MDNMIVKPKSTGDAKFDQQLLEIETGGDSNEKRLAMYKHLRDKMVSGLKSDQESEHRAKMELISKHIEVLELAQKHQ